MKNSDQKNTICLVGNGRLATQLKAYLNQSALPHTHIYRSQHNEKEMELSIRASSHVWLAISDSGIESFYERFNSDDSKIWIHFSGAHNSKSLFSVHPIMTFSKSPMSLAEFEKIHFTVSPPESWDNERSMSLPELLIGSKNPWSALRPNQKAFYHALCVMSGNFPIVLWSEVLEQFERLNIPSEALTFYLDRILSNFKNEGALALTGPLARKDLDTIRSNLNALNTHPLKAVYESFVTAKGIKL